jgi:hypothetical protein
MTVYTINADTASRSLNQSGATYSTVRGNAVSKTPEVSGLIGQWMDSIDVSPYKIGRQALIFDTSSVPPSETISSAILRLKCYSKYCDTNFDFVICMGDPTHPGKPVVIQDYAIGNIDGVDGDYNDVKSSASVVVDSTFDINFNSIGFLLINKGGETRLYLLSSRDINANEPASDTDEYIEFYDPSTASPPQLIVTTTPPVESSGTTFEYLSELQESVTISADPTPRAFPDVVVPALPDGYTVYSATMFVKYRRLENGSVSDNKLEGDQNVIIQKDSGALIVCMNLKDDMLQVEGGASSNGDTLYSDLDISAIVTGAGTYGSKIKNAHADYTSMYLKDVQVGIRIVMRND